MPKDPYAVLRALLRAEAIRESRADRPAPVKPAPGARPAPARTADRGRG